MALLLPDGGAFEGEPEEVTDLQTRTICRTVTATDLALMGATLATGGLNTVTGQRAVDAKVARATIAVMAIAPPLDAAGSSVKGLLVAKQLARELDLDIFASTPASTYGAPLRYPNELLWR